MIHSVRARLAAWYGGTFAVLLATFALGAYWFLGHTTRERIIDEFLAETANAVGNALAGASHDGPPDATNVAMVVGEFSFRDIGVAVYDGDHGSLIAASPAHPVTASAALPEGAIEPTIAPVGLTGTEPLLRTIELRGGEEVAAYAVRVAVAGRPLIIEATQSLRGQESALSEARAALLIGIPVGLILATVGGYVLGRKSLQPVVAMSDAAARIGATTLRERLPVGNPRDELGRLATVFNDLLFRLGESFDQQRRFMADASHELRTPVAIVKGEAELALSRDDRTVAELRDALDTVHAESRRLTRIVDDLFLLARANAGDQPLVPADLYLEELLGECVRAVRTLAGRAGVTIHYRPEGDLPFRGDEALLRRMLDNLLANAIKFTPPGGSIRITAGRDDGLYRVDVADTGPGIPAEAQPHIFERFYRVRRAAGERSAVGDEMAGAGLGLPIARWIAEVHGGRLDLTRTDATGSTFTVELPVVEQPPGRIDA
jgi:heavy metal sensor kinase